MSYEYEIQEKNPPKHTRKDFTRPKGVSFRHSLFAKFLWAFIVVPFSALTVLIYLNESSYEINQKYFQYQNFHSEVLDTTQNLVLQISKAQSHLFRQLNNPSDKNRSEFQNVWAQIWQDITALKNLPQNLQLASLDHDLGNSFNIIVKGIQNLSALSGEVLVFTKPEKLKELESSETLLSENLKNLVFELKNIETRILLDIQKSEEDRFWIIFSILCSTLVFLLTLFIYFSFDVSRRIKNIHQRCLALSSQTPDLTLHIENHGNDELGRMTEAFDQFIDKTYNLVYTIATNTGQVLDSITTVSQQIKHIAEDTHLLEGNASTEQVCMELCDVAVRSLNTGLNFTISAIQEIIGHTLDVQKQMNISNQKVKEAFENVQGCLKKTIRTDFNTKELLKTMENLRYDSINMNIELYNKFNDEDPSFVSSLHFSKTLDNVLDVVEICFLSIKEANESITKSSNLATDALIDATKLSEHLTSLEFDINRIQKGVVSHTTYVSEVSKQVSILGTTISSNGNAIHNLAKSAERMTKESNNLHSLIDRLNQAVALFQIYKEQEIQPILGETNDKQKVA